eukprot:TRINITY_DN4894_c0_g1_i1.p1 TRINITY_DN4894_c0_g1~~TRINITY_DN4894_c0_g1_i1.p1  ORF type:complete len:1083 (-),score=294.21 TRINITY_DN4894_c0_g1_i1:104-3352(-)
MQRGFALPEPTDANTTSDAKDAINTSSTLGITHGDIDSVTQNPIKVQLFYDPEENESMRTSSLQHGESLGDRKSTLSTASSLRLESRRSIDENPAHRYQSLAEHDFLHNRSSFDKDVRILQERVSQEMEQNSNVTELRKSLLHQLDVIREARRGMSSEIAFAESELQEENTKLRQLRTAKQTFHRKFVEIEEERQKVQDELEKTRVDVKLIFDHAQDLKNKKKSLQSKREKLLQVKKQLESQITENEQSIREETLQVQQHDTLLKQREADLSKMRREKVEKQDSINFLLSESAAEKKSLHDLEQQRTRLEAAFQGHQSYISQLKGNVAVFEEKVSLTQKEMKELEENKLEIERQWHTLINSKSKLEEKIQEMKSEIVQMQSDIEFMQNEQREVTEKHASFSVNRKAVQTELQKIQAAVSKVTQEGAQVQEANGRLTRELAEERQKLARLQEENSALQGAIHEVQTQIQELTEKHETSLQDAERILKKREELAEYFQEVQESEQQLGELQGAIDQLKEILNSAQEKKSSLQTILSNLQVSIQDAKDASDQVTSDINELLVSKRATEMSLETAKKEQAQLRQHIVKLEQDSKAEKSNLEAITAHSRMLQLKYDELLKQRQQTEQAYQALLEGYNSQKSRMDELEGDFNRKKEELASYSNAIIEQERSNRRLREEAISLEDKQRSLSSQKEDLLHILQSIRAKTDSIESTVRSVQAHVISEDAKLKLHHNSLAGLEEKLNETQLALAQSEEKRQRLLVQIAECEDKKNQMNREILGLIQVLRSEKDVHQESQAYINQLQRDLDHIRDAKGKTDLLLQELKVVKSIEEESLFALRNHHHQFANSLQKLQEQRTAYGSQKELPSPPSSTLRNQTYPMSSPSRVFGGDGGHSISQTLGSLGGIHGGKNTSSMTHRSSVGERSHRLSEKPHSPKMDRSMMEESIDLSKLIAEGNVDDSIFALHPESGQFSKGLVDIGELKTAHPNIDEIIARLSHPTPGKSRDTSFAKTSGTSQIRAHYAYDNLLQHDSSPSPNKSKPRQLQDSPIQLKSSTARDKVSEEEAHDSMDETLQMFLKTQVYSGEADASNSV